MLYSATSEMFPFHSFISNLGLDFMTGPTDPFFPFDFFLYLRKFKALHSFALFYILLCTIVVCINTSS